MGGSYYYFFSLEGLSPLYSEVMLSVNGSDPGRQTPPPPLPRNLSCLLIAYAVDPLKNFWISFFFPKGLGLQLQ